MDEDYNLAERYRIVRKHLDRLGYRQALSLDALPLIERLLADLIQTTDSLKHYKSVAQDNIEACSQLQLATEPYKCDNARLVHECNQLHLKLLETDENHQKQIKELKKQLRKLEHECNDLQLVSSRNIKKVKELEAESAAKTHKVLELQGKCCKPVISNTNLATKKRACYPLRRPTLESDPLPRTGSCSTTFPSSSNVDPHVVDLLAMADHRMNCINREVTKLKGDLSVQNDTINTLKSQLATKEKEIMRLKKMLDGGRPFSAVTKDCFCKKVEKNHYGDGGEMKILERSKQDLEEQLKDSMVKQHEAMSRALKLAERNEELEKELRDIDHIALAVEADCNSAVQENNRRVSRLQEKVEDLMTQVHVLESELTVERRGAQELRADLEASKLEKRNIQRVLESTLDEKKQMTDRINQLTIIEKDLNDTIEKLTREITRLESSNSILKNEIFVNGNSNGGGGGGGGDDREKHKDKIEKNDKNKGKKILKKRTIAGKAQSTSPTMNKQNLNANREDEVSKDVTNPGTRFYETPKAENEKDSIIESLKKTIERLETERDYYRNEYNKFREEFNLISNGDNADLWTQACELRRQLNEKEQAMAELQREKKASDREKFNLEARLQTSKNQQRRTCVSCGLCSPCRPNSTASQPSAGDASSTKAMLERLERERDTARADVDRLAEERDALRERLKIAVDAHTSEQRRLRENLLEAETRLKQLETERQDLMLSQGTRRATINGLEDQLEDLRQELRRTKEELTTQRTQYFQLRALQEQTDQALGDVQGQLGQSETELNKMIDHKRSIEQQQMQLDNQVKELKQECNMLRSNLAQLDQEKDQLLMNLDEKTERIAALEREVRFKEQQGNGLEQQVLDFQHKYQICVDQTAEQERQLRTMEVEINNLQRQLSSASMDRENAIRENARIQDDLASVTCECRNLQRELEASRAESHDLKRQLQTYVTEVRRAEDLLNRKENERSEMLNHFRSLSLEATVLETNNQSLESEAAEARGALQTAQDRLLDLERQIADRDCLVRGYETQIAELTQNVASMETQLHQQAEQRKRAEADLNAVRDLCVKLDQQKESLEAQLGDKESMRIQCETQLTRLRTEQNMVQDQMSRDNAAVDRLEAMLNQARQESMNNQANNQELQSEMARLKQKISDLQNKLLAETSELRRYQNQAAEYSKQISELRRQMTNERFDRARKEEENRRIDSPDNLVKKTCPPCSAFQVPTPAPRPDPKSVNQWKTPAPRMPEVSRDEEDCSCKPDLKTEAQRTNRFNTNSSQNSPSFSYLTPCNHIESTNDHKPQEKDDIPCINIILKPISDHKTNLNDKEIQIVEITAVTENNNKHLIDNNTYNLLPDLNNNQTPFKEIEKVETKSVKVQTKVEKNVQDSSTQTAETPTRKKSVDVDLTKEKTAEVTQRDLTAGEQAPAADTSKSNRGVQFQDNNQVSDNVGCLDTSKITGADSNRKSLPKCDSLRSRDAREIVDIDDSTIMGSIDDQRSRKTDRETSVSPIEYPDSMETLYKSLNSRNKSNRSSEFRSCVKQIGGEGKEGKLSDRIKRNIDKLEIGNCVSTQSSVTNTSLGNERKSVRTETKITSCNDLCKNLVSQPELELSKTYSDKSSGTLASVVSNNPPVPRISLNTTESAEWESPRRNKSSKVTTGTTVSDSSFSPILDISSCCSNNKFSTGSICPTTRDSTFGKECSDNGGIVCGNLEQSDEIIVKKDEISNSQTRTRGFLSNEGSTLSKFGIQDGISSGGTKSTNTLNEIEALESTGEVSPLINDDKFSKQNTLNCSKRCRSTGVQTNSVSFSGTREYSDNVDYKSEEKPDFTSSRENTRSFIRASDLTRPEFIRMLTEIKEHTCSLELQLSAMNEALKRKQATRNKVLSSTLKNHEPLKQDQFFYATQNKKIKDSNESSCCGNDSSYMEHAKRTPEGSNIENLMIRDDNSVSEDNKQRKNETMNAENSCGGTISNEINRSYIPIKLPKKLKPSLHTVRSSKPQEIVVVQDESDISISKSNRPRKPAFKTKRNHLWSPLRESDYRMWKQKLHRLTPSERSMIVPEILSQQSTTISPDSMMVESKIDDSCSPTNCCDSTEDNLQMMFKAGDLSTINKIEKSNVTLGPDNYSTNSNLSGNYRMTGRPAFMNSTFKKNVKSNPTTEYKAVARSGSLRDREIPQVSLVGLESSDCSKTISGSIAASCDLDTSICPNSNNGGKSSENTKMETVCGKIEKSRENVIPTSPSKLRKPNVPSRLGIKRSSLKFRTKNRPKSIPSNSHLNSSVSGESIDESLPNNSSKNHKTEHDPTKHSPFKLKKLGVDPRLKLMSINSENPSLNYIENDDSQSYLDPGCCESIAKGENDDEMISGVSISSHSNRNRSLSLPAEEILTKLLDRKGGNDNDHFTYNTIKTEQNTPLSVNNFGKFDSEEEMSSTDYHRCYNKSGEDYCGKEIKDNVNGKKRKRKSAGDKKFVHCIDEKSVLNNFDAPAEMEDSKNTNSKSYSEYREHSESDSKTKRKNSESVSSGNENCGKILEFNHFSGKLNQGNSIGKDSKCTIRVTVSLDNTISSEEVKEI